MRRLQRLGDVLLDTMLVDESRELLTKPLINEYLTIKARNQM